MWWEWAGRQRPRPGGWGHLGEGHLQASWCQVPIGEMGLTRQAAHGQYQEHCGCSLGVVGKMYVKGGNLLDSQVSFIGLPERAVKGLLTTFV